MRGYCPPGVDRLRRLASGRGMAGDAELGRKIWNRTGFTKSD
jgi:hypothetical protein